MIYLEDFAAFSNCSIVRDDLLPFYYGGNKARKAIEYASYIVDNGYSAVVTTGGIQSNHCRAVALMARQKNLSCHIVYHGSKERFDLEKGNAKIVKAAGVNCEFVHANEIGPSMDHAMEQYMLRGDKPLYITGGGHDMMGGIAYAKAVQELHKAWGNSDVQPKYIFLPTGTGSTQAGIVIGLELCGWGKTKVVGISIARQKQRAMEVTKDFTASLAKLYGIGNDITDKIIITDAFLEGGYEQYSEAQANWIDKTISTTGIIFDTTYSGKALWGMKNTLQEWGKEDARTIFWHTGGQLNFLA